MLLTSQECRRLLEILSEKHGAGYAEGIDGTIQAKLSIMLEAKKRTEALREGAKQIMRSEGEKQ